MGQLDKYTMSSNSSFRVQEFKFKFNHETEEFKIVEIKKIIPFTT